MSNSDSNVLDMNLQASPEKLEVGEPPQEINDRNEDQQMARWAARRRASEMGGDY